MTAYGIVVPPRPQPGEPKAGEAFWQVPGRDQALRALCRQGLSARKVGALLGCARGVARHRGLTLGLCWLRSAPTASAERVAFSRTERRMVASLQRDEQRTRGHG
jgi:hypothetical protein